MVDVSGSEGRDPIEDFEKINNELGSFGEKLLKKPQLVAANKMDMLDEEDERYLSFKKHVEEKGYRVFPISAPINQGVHELLAAAAAELHRIEQEPREEEVYELFDFEKDQEDPDYREIYASRDGKDYVLEGKQLQKIFNSTNFNDYGSLRYLYKYIEKNGGIEKLKELGLEEGDTIRVFDYEFEYIDE